MPEKIDPSKPEGHIAQFPKGFKRDEENARRTDRLAEEGEKARDLGEGDRSETFDKAALEREDNEIMRLVRQDTGTPDIIGAQPDKVYLWVPQMQGSRVVAHCQLIRNTLVRFGWERVEADMPECNNQDFRGVGAAEGSSQRGWGDCVLYRIDKDRYWKILIAKQRLEFEKQGIEKSFEVYWNEKYGRQLGPGLAHGDPRDPMVQRTVFAGAFGQTDTIIRPLMPGGRLPG